VTASRFVVQLHDATALHFDLRIQVGEVLRSWAVPKGPSLDPRVRRLAVPVADHDLAAGDFEGVHQGQPRGSGAVIIWDEGGADITRDEPGHLSFALSSLVTWWFAAPHLAGFHIDGDARSPEAHARHRALIVETSSRLLTPADNNAKRA